MKKILILIAGTLLIANVSLADMTNGFSIGITGSNNDVDTTVTDDIDSDGTITTTKALSDSITAGSIFSEYTLTGGSFGVILGFDVIPFAVDLDKRSTTQSTVGALGVVATSGTNSGEATVGPMKTIYLQPGYVFGSTMLYLTAGLVRADIDASVVTVTGSTITNKVQTLEGTKIGFGFKHEFGSGIFMKADYSETDYDKVSYKTSANSTTVTADLDNTAGSLSLGMAF